MKPFNIKREDNQSRKKVSLSENPPETASTKTDALLLILGFSENNSL